MPIILEQIFGLLVEPPGNLIYHLVVVFASMAGLQTVFLLESSANRQSAGRMKIGFLVILAGQVFMFVMGALGWQKIVDAQVVLPLLDRLIILLSVIWIGWMLVNPPVSRTTDIIVGSLSLGAIVLFAITLLLWQPFAGRVTHNGSPYDLNWDVLFLLTDVIGVIILANFKPENWGTGVGFFAILIAGGILHLVVPFTSSDYPAAVRLAIVSSFPLLPGLSWALKPTADAPAGKRRTPATPSPLGENQIPALKAWAHLAGSTDPRELGPNLVQAIGRSVNADLCAWVNCLDNSGALSITCGYDLVRGEVIASRQIPRNSVPNLAQALESGKDLNLPVADKHFMQDLDTLAFTMGIPVPVNTLAIPIRNPGALWSGILVFSQKPERQWTTTDSTTLKLLCEDSASILVNRNLPAEKPRDSDNYQRLYAKSLQDLASAREELRLVLEGLDPLPAEQNADRMDVTLASIIAVQHESEQTIQKLEHENSTLRLALDQHEKADGGSDSQTYEQELRTCLEELAHLQNAVAEANVTIMDLQQRGNQHGQPTAENLSQILQSVRSMNGPVSSVLAYSELLGSDGTESPDPALIDHLRESANQLKSILAELLLTTHQITSPFELAARPVPIVPVIQEVLAGIAPIADLKKIDVIVTMSETIPPVFADRDALLQIFGYLLQNGVTVTPSHGKLTVDANVTNVNGDTPYFIFQVTDEGGGISPGETGKVFDRNYRTDHPAIAGVGDRGVGLAITRTLVEAHQGRIWVDSRGNGQSTFSVLLPVETTGANGFTKSS